MKLILLHTRFYCLASLFLLIACDPETITDRASFEQPHQYPDGIRFVFVNGVAAVDEGKYMNTRSGKVLRRNSNKNPGQ